MSMSQYIKTVSSLLSEIVKDNENKSPSSRIHSLKEEKTGFDCKKAPTISILGYLERLIRYSNCEESTIIITLIYIDKVCERNGLVLNSYNIHR